MKVLLDIKDNKAQSLMEVLKGLSYVKTKTITDSKAEFIENAKTAVDEMNQVKAKKIKPKAARDFLSEI
ncbi:hypothetical protein [Leptospira meyeri]|uniref:hypothetical protein n=1 Tax=Leptospira meyeri TaxID=29508 RepID=UPI00108392B9|nr:hypothetical protein [Leptospira meyeri]TGL16861.1 hypothetical protein EHQ50_00080 [Leptospira meyeri]